MTEVLRMRMARAPQRLVNRDVVGWATDTGPPDRRFWKSITSPFSWDCLPTVEHHPRLTGGRSYDNAADAFVLCAAQNQLQYSSRCGRNVDADFPLVFGLREMCRGMK